MNYALNNYRYNRYFPKIFFELEEHLIKLRQEIETEENFRLLTLKKDLFMEERLRDIKKIERLETDELKNMRETLRKAIRFKHVLIELRDAVDKKRPDFMNDEIFDNIGGCIHYAHWLVQRLENLAQRHDYRSFRLGLIGLPTAFNNLANSVNALFVEIHRNPQNKDSLFRILRDQNY